MALDLSALGGLANATPWGAAANALGGALTSTLPSTANQGPLATGPVSVNVAGFGSRATGSPSQSLTQAEPDRGGAFPASVVGDAAGAALPSWVIPAGGVLLLLVVVASLVRR